MFQKAFVCVMLLSGSVWASDWTQFRGPNANGQVDAPVPTDISPTKNVLWKVQIPGEGWSAPVIHKDRAYISTAVRTDGATDAGPEPYRGGGGRRRDQLMKYEYQWELHCLNAETGEPIWKRVATKGNPPMPRHSSNTYATETPIVDGERVYVYFGMIGVFAFDLEGQPLWKRDLGSYTMRAGWGTSSSPAYHDGRLFIQVDNEEQSFLTALDGKTGETVWKVDREERSQYGSPLVWKNSLRTEIITIGMTTRSNDPKTGELLWSLDMRKGRSSATPVAVGDVLFVGNEFRNRGGSDDGGGYLFAVRPGGSGDITPTLSAKSTDHIAWQTERAGLQMASPVVSEGQIFLFERRRPAVHVLDIETGQNVYTARIPNAAPFWSSPLVSDGQVMAIDANGTVHVLEAGTDSLNVLRTNVLDERTWSTPSAANGRLYIRTVEHLYCFAK